MLEPADTYCALLKAEGTLYRFFLFFLGVLKETFPDLSLLRIASLNEPDGTMRHAGTFWIFSHILDQFAVF